MYTRIENNYIIIIHFLVITFEKIYKALFLTFLMLEIEVIKEIPYQENMDWHLVEKWAETIPRFSKKDPKHPEWKPTPIKRIDLSSEGFGEIYVKDESDPQSNPNKVIKDRMAWEETGRFRDYGLLLHQRRKEGILNGNLSLMKVPRLTYVTAGNVGKSLSNFFEKYSLPPIKLLMDKQTYEKNKGFLTDAYADIYITDLSKKNLSSKMIKRFTNNNDGLDITSLIITKPHEVWYDWHFH